MGWFDGASAVSSHSSSHHSHSTHKHNGKDKPTIHHFHTAPSLFGTTGAHDKGKQRHDATKSIFGSGSHPHRSSRSSFFGFEKSHSSSYRRPRNGYIKRLYNRLRRLIRDLLYYMKRNPMKVFVLVILPLITGGALTGLLRKFDIRLPGGLDRIFGGGASIGRGGNGGLQWERTRVNGPMGALGSMASGMGGYGGVVGLAKMFV